MSMDLNIEDDESSTLLNYIDNGGEDKVNENNDQGERIVMS